MKNIRKYSLIGLLFLICGLSSCDTDNDGATYKGTGISFLWGETEVVVGPNDTSFDVRVTRSTTVGAETVTVTSAGNAIFTVPSSVTFADGEGTAFIQVSFASLEFDKIYELTINLPEDKLSVSGIGTAELEISKDYEWVSLGTGKFADNWAFPLEYDVEILKADGYDRYRVVEPYKQGFASDDGEWEDWISGTGPAYIEFWETGSGDLVRFKSYEMGLNYEASKEQPIKAWYPIDQDSSASIAYNKKLGTGSYQLAPIYWIENVGGWDNSTENEVILITLP